ncbi:hypothetical protein [Cellulomonas hominis]|uniref:hypothetical protein n=1 Tax=Cellulomonas hominis TaxID=156981 RepID=UPI001B9DD334|nr:hypothetical protein [Cellulomonas hominis]VTR76351.1 hypothetical protein CHMI_01110 [Cellulomonas hominis]
MVTLVERTVHQPVSTQVPAGAASHLVVEHLGDLLVRADAHLTRERFTNENFTKDDPYRVRGQEVFVDAVQQVSADLGAFSARFPDQRGLVASFSAALATAATRETGLGEIGVAYRSALEAFRDAFEPSASGSRAHAVFTDEGLDVYVRVVRPQHASADQDFLAAASALLGSRREAEDNLTVDERIAVRAAYWLLDQGVQIPGSFPIWGTSGFRDVQTYASITDPGEGHLAGTTVFPGNLHGVIVHVEHLERGVDRSRDELEPYRIPSPRMVARVRLHVGAAAPTSSYIGRPLFDGTVADSLIKTSRTFAAAASSLLSDGLAEVKFAVERLTAREAVELLSSLAREVRRDRHAQVLSAAVNINIPILDDRSETVKAHGEARWASTHEEIGLLGVAIAVAAGFDKVTWDGTADTYPSRCITDQLTRPVALSLVHRAHESGLLTYFSAGFRYDNIPDAVISGVDGIGIGGAQILRYMDKVTGNHGPFLPGNIQQILAVRDAAAETPAGRGGQLLARLDRLYYEGTLDIDAEPWRERLFTALQEDDEAAISEALDALQNIADREPDTAPPLLAWAGRLVSAGNVLARNRIDSRHWDPLMGRIRDAASRGDIVALEEHLRPATVQPRLR